MVLEGLAEPDLPLFSIADYVVFSLMICVSAGIGIYYAFSGGGQKTTKEFLLADRQMHVVPVAMSLMASFMSAITVLGTPAEVYTHGTMFWMFWITYIFMIVISAHLYMPVFFNLGVTSAYEYLERRFSVVVRRLGCATFILQMTIYMGICLYAPALALEEVTGVNLWGAVLTLGVVCTFYTTIGGMKAVMWTDTFQVCVMCMGFLAVIIQGSINVGGFGEVWSRNLEGDRLTFFVWDVDPRIRHSTWSVLFGGGFMWIAVFGVNQAQVQRYLSCKNLRKAQTALYLNVPGLFVIVTLASLCGLVMYALNRECDPVTAEYLKTSDQLMPYTVMMLLSWLPGLPGVFVSAVFAGALSTMSSGLNSLAAVTLEDFIKPFKKDLSERQYTNISKVLVAVYGALMILLAWASSFMGAVLQAALGMFGMVGGPLLGVFSLGIFFPCANTVGAVVGIICGFLMTFWVGIGAQIYKPIVPRPPVTIAGCPLANHTDSNFTTSTVSMVTDLLGTTSVEDLVASTEERPAIAEFYNISYLWYGVLAVFVVVTVGLIVSFITGPQNPAELDPRLITPLFDTACCCCPGRCRHTLWCGVRHDDKDVWIEHEKEETEKEMQRRESLRIARKESLKARKESLKNKQEDNDVELKEKGAKVETPSIGNKDSAV
ncbi:PREDICTED: sodium-coupled monocarboxylate transporter 1-like [Branchiostoma belcheri]|uniref:Sodium-coupled monocarboxylate transporter 1-like n=1 Tax=Branchiostoma belcheri TaxID=7741 RepID=A0A6P5A8N9_BRABE|nr:PREDICTED: sodium-coupled monocarboxylate transporter 1-like [Branchiostoma belcheri]